MSTLEKAIEIAAINHAGDKDKAGAPYLLHPLRLMFAVRTEFEMMVAVLHDVVEDTSISLQDLENEGFHPDVIMAVDALTKRPGESRIESASRAASNSIARNVKLADVNDNMDLKRISVPKDKDFERLKEYAEVRKFLINHGAT